MKRLFDDTENYNKDGLMLARTSRSLLSQLFESYEEKGYSIMDIKNVIEIENNRLCYEKILKKRG